MSFMYFYTFHSLHINCFMCYVLRLGEREKQIQNIPEEFLPQSWGVYVVWSFSIKFACERFEWFPWKLETIFVDHANAQQKDIKLSSWWNFKLDQLGTNFV